MPAVAGTGGVGGMILPLLLRPVDTMAARRQSRYERQQLVGLLAQEQERRLATLKANQTAVQNDLHALSNLDVLPTGKSRIQSEVAAPIKAEIADRIKNQYNGDYEQFLNAEGDYHSNRIREAVANHPVVQRELQNKLNYGLLLKDQMDGKILRPGAQESLIDYTQNGTGNINYNGSIEPIKDLQDHFGKTFHPSGNYNLGIIDPKTGFQRAPGVMRQDVIDYAKSTGMSEADAQFYVNDHLNYKDGQFAYKIDQQNPNWLQNMRNDQTRLGLQARSVANAERNSRLANYYRAREDARSQERLNLAKDRAATGGTAATDFPGYDLARRVFDTNGTPIQPNSKILSVPILQTAHQTALGEFAGLQKVDQGTGLADTYSLQPNASTKLYQKTANGIAPIKKYRPLLSDTGTIDFDNVNLSAITKIPDPKSRGGYGRFVTVHKGNQDYYIKLPDSDDALHQLYSNPNAGKTKLPKANQVEPVLTDGSNASSPSDPLDPNAYW